jgi:zona occludens toxin
MITLITGVPRAGKSAYIVWHIIKKHFDAGRLVYTAGIPELKIPVIQVTYADVRKWSEREQISPPDVAPENAKFRLTNFQEGSVIVVDEVADLWPVQTRSNKAVSDDIEYLRKHRKHALDIVLVTQKPGYVDPLVLGVVEQHIHLWPHWAGRRQYEWTEYCSNPASKTNKDQAVEKKYKLPRQVFGLYYSATAHLEPQKGIPLRLYTSIAALIIAPVLVFLSVDRIKSRTEAPTIVSEEVVAAPMSSAAVAAPVAPSVLAPASVPVPAPVSVSEKPASMSVQLLTAAIDWKIVSACLQSEKNGCICYGKSAERLVIPKESCELAVKHGWASL